VLCACIVRSDKYSCTLDLTLLTRTFSHTRLAFFEIERQLVFFYATCLHRPVPCFRPRIRNATSNMNHTKSTCCTSTTCCTKYETCTGFVHVWLS
jgi:hypothetical protein